MARPEGLEPPTLCFEGRCSIQLSYRRTEWFCNLITVLAGECSDSPKRLFPRCAQFCAHPVGTSQRTSRPRKDEHSAKKVRSGYAQRFEPASRRRSRIRPDVLETCAVENRVQMGARASHYSSRPLRRSVQMPLSVASLGLRLQRVRYALTQAKSNLRLAFPQIPNGIPVSTEPVESSEERDGQPPFYRVLQRESRGVHLPKLQLPKRA
jgi:hypothetical protein